MNLSTPPTSPGITRHSEPSGSNQVGITPFSFPDPGIDPYIVFHSLLTQPKLDQEAAKAAEVKAALQEERENSISPEETVVETAVVTDTAAQARFTWSNTEAPRDLPREDSRTASIKEKPSRQTKGPRIQASPQHKLKQQPRPLRRQTCFVHPNGIRYFYAPRQRTPEQEEERKREKRRIEGRVYRGKTHRRAQLPNSQPSRNNNGNHSARVSSAPIRIPPTQRTRNATTSTTRQRIEKSAKPNPYNPNGYGYSSTQTAQPLRSKDELSRQELRRREEIIRSLLSASPKNRQTFKGLSRLSINNPADPAGSENDQPDFLFPDRELLFGDIISRSPSQVESGTENEGDSDNDNYNHDNTFDYKANLTSHDEEKTNRTPNKESSKGTGDRNERTSPSSTSKSKPISIPGRRSTSLASPSANRRANTTEFPCGSVLRTMPSELFGKIDASDDDSGDDDGTAADGNAANNNTSNITSEQEQKVSSSPTDTKVSTTTKPAPTTPKPSRLPKGW
jgi:hypothetical protein